MKHVPTKIGSAAQRFGNTKIMMILISKKAAPTPVNGIILILRFNLQALGYDAQLRANGNFRLSLCLIL
jgi:hypothetical protein